MPSAFQILVLGAIYIALGLVSDGSYAVIGAYAGRRVTRARVSRHRGGVAEGLLLVGLGVSTLAIPHHDTRR